MVGSSSSSIIFRYLFENVLALSIDNKINGFVAVFDHVFTRGSNCMFTFFW
jgi:hypothetical protein